MIERNLLYCICEEDEYSPLEDDAIYANLFKKALSENPLHQVTFCWFSRRRSHASSTQKCRMF